MAPSARTTRLLACLVLLPSAAGCGGRAPEPEHGGVRAEEALPPPPPPELLSLLPADVTAVVRWDLVQLRESAYYPLAFSLLQMALAAEADRVPADLLDLLERTDEAVVGLTLAADGARDVELCLLLRGRYGASALETATRALESVVEDQTGDQGGQQGPARDRLALTGLGDHTWIVARLDRIDALLARASGATGEPGFHESEAFRSLAGSVRFTQAPVAAVALFDVETRRALLRQVQQGASAGPLGAAVAQAIVGGAARVDLDQGLSVQGFVETTNALVAAALTDILDEVIGEALGNLATGPTIPSHRVRVEGNRVRLSVVADDEQVRALVSRMEGRTALGDAFGDGRREPAETPHDEREEEPPEEQ